MFRRRLWFKRLGTLRETGLGKGALYTRILPFYIATLRGSSGSVNLARETGLVRERAWPGTSKVTYKLIDYTGEKVTNIGILLIPLNYFAIARCEGS